MEIEIKVISTEIIKPSSPTPKVKQKHQLSLFDQLMPPFFLPLIYFYAPNPKTPNLENTKQLKKSLSEVLSKFYPLAGRLVGNLYVDCNDAGVPFFEAAASCDLSQVIYSPNPKEMKAFRPNYETDEHEPHGFCMAVQATYFRCGGLAVGILVSHKIADALSFNWFVSTWSAVARNGHCRGVPPPMFDAAAHFPPRMISGYQSTTGMQKEAVATEIFTFPASKIAALQEMYSAAGERRPTKVEALSVFIWTQFVSASGTKPDPNKFYAMMHTVNLRTRADPPLSEYLFGNIFGLSTANPSAGDSGAELMQKMRKAVKAVNGGVMARLKNGEKLRKEMWARAEKGELVYFNFSSLCGVPLYETDFGSGRPVWIGPGEHPYTNLALFIDAKDGVGIDAMIYLKKQDMEKFGALFVKELKMLKSKL